jgi:nitrite reductase/ring-hydroxylating ferredoxin subunit
MAYARAAKTGDVPPGMIVEVEVGGKAIALANVEGKYHAIGGVCAHQGGPLGEGAMDGCTVICPWHAWEYDITSGKLVGNPEVSVESYPTEIRGEEVFVDLG